MHNLFKCCVFLAVLVAPGLSVSINVCQEEDKEIRIDCIVEPKTNQINNYEFSISKAGREYIINTNVSGSVIDTKFKDKTRVEQLGPEVYRLTLNSYTLSENTTFICKSNTLSANVLVMKDKMLLCSAISVFLQNCPWLLYLLLFLYTLQSWGLVLL